MWMLVGTGCVYRMWVSECMFVCVYQCCECVISKNMSVYVCVCMYCVLNECVCRGMCMCVSALSTHVIQDCAFLRSSIRGK